MKKKMAFEDKIKDLQEKLSSQIKKEQELNEKIKEQLAKVGIEI